MSRPVKPGADRRRAYDSSRRQAQARQTRRSILEAARAMFIDRGYAPTTIAAVATAAGVSVETVYKTFGNKPGLAKAVLDVAIVGDDEPVPMMQREFVTRNKAEPDPAKRLVEYGHHIAEVAARVGAILLVVRAAASTDEGAAAVWATMQEERLVGMTHFARHLHEGGHLRAGVTVREAADVLWTLNSVEMWDLLVRQRGWSYHRFGDWMGRQLIAALLPQATAIVQPKPVSHYPVGDKHVSK